MHGILYALGAAILFGASAPIAKMLLDGISPWLLAGLLYLGSGLGLAALRLIPSSKEAPLVRTDWPWLAAAIFAGGVCGPVLLMFGLSATAGSTAALLLNLESVLTLAIAWIVFREYVDLRLGIGALAIVLGAGALSWQGGVAETSSTIWGPLLIAGACLAWAVDNNLTRKISAADPNQIAMLKGLVAGAVNVALALGAGNAMPAAPTLIAASVVGFLGYGVSLALFILALRHLGTARTGAYYALAPFIGAALAIPLLDEPVTLPFLLGGAAMAVGFWLHLTERHQHSHVHEPMEHDHLHVHDAHHQHAHDDHPLSDPHAHPHRHGRLVHKHIHFPDLHHRHSH